MELRARKEKPLRYKILSGAIIPASQVYVNETKGCCGCSGKWNFTNVFALRAGSPGDNRARKSPRCGTSRRGVNAPADLGDRRASLPEAPRLFGSTASAARPTRFRRGPDNWSSARSLDSRYI